MITQARLKELLHYDPLTGIFTRRTTTARCSKVGEAVGSTTTRGYLRLQIDLKCYFAQRLAWLYMYGAFPAQQVDHINGRTNDNRIDNLREVSNRGNGLNRPEHRAGHMPGTTFHRSTQKWRAQIQVNGRKSHIGLYDTQLEAHQAYLLELMKVQQGLLADKID